MPKLILGAALATALLGCAAPIEVIVPDAIGGSKADGTMVMGFSHSPQQKSKIDWPQAQSIASNRCQGWGYWGAQEFTNDQRDCVKPSGRICIEERVRRNYQCVG